MGTIQLDHRGYIIIHPTDKIITIIEVKTTYILEVCSKDYIISKTFGVNNKCRVFIDHHIVVKFRVANFVKATRAAEVVVQAREKNCELSSD